jgi:sec-independent protein translocase protein TatB
MFGISGWEFIALAVLAMLIFGPNQLPKALAQVRGLLRQFRGMADSAKRDLQEGLGPEFKDFDVQDLNPKRFLHKHLLEDDESPSSARKSRTATRLNGRRPPFDNEAT